MPEYCNHETRIVLETLNGNTSTKGYYTKKKGLIDREIDGGGFQSLDILKATRESDWDTDQDGIPNWFESLLGSNPNVANNNNDTDGDGYTDLEEWLDWLSQPHLTLAPDAATTIDLRPYFAGFEMAGAIGAMLRAAELGMTVMVDGFIMSACMLAASRLVPEVLSYAVFCHCGDESGHQRMLSLMDAQPLLHLGMRLGEGTGALCAYPIIDSAVRMVNEMNNFENAKITKYF
jgi:hypothetical protein